VFFPGTPITTSLEYCIIDKGTVVKRTTIARGGEGVEVMSPRYARFHATPDGRLYVFGAFGAKGKGLENRLIEMQPNGNVGPSATVPLSHPFGSFMTAGERAGSPASDTLDLLGEAHGVPGISYARIRLRR
jgi:hypothetical protein